jgi:predicted O-linked N-acetylglucosamine transferase (SPINDLY family)/2-polyprenyl-3-methyl-5-hydroxy-6-metoxy-1,4-benzoquinol methylase
VQNIRRAEELIVKGNSLEDKGDFGSALELYRQATALAPDFARAWVNTGNALQLLGHIDQAIVAQRTAVRLDPEHAPAHYNLGALLARRNEPIEAERELRESLRLRPDMVDSMIFLADVLTTGGRLEEAEVELRRALALRPESAMSANNLAGILIKRERVDEAEDVIRRAIALSPDVAPLNGMLASMYVKAGRAKDAEPYFRAALASPDTIPDTQSAYLFSLNLRDDLDAQRVFAEHRRIGALIDGAAKPDATGFPNRPDPDRPLRIGYVSGDFRQHPVALFMRPVLEQHDRSHFEVHCYANNPIDDDFTRVLRPAVAHWHPVAGLTDTEVVNRIRHDAIDILIDLSGHTAESRLTVFPHRPAPVAAEWLGYLNTTGLVSMNGRICDWYTDPSPEAESLHTERLWRMPHSQWCYKPAYSVALTERPHPDEPGALVFGSFNQFPKVSDDCLRLWGLVLARLPAAKLRVYGVPEGRTRMAFVERLARAGLDSSRASLYGRTDVLKYFAAISDVDIALDSFPYNGATTTLDTLWMGVPLVGLCGSRGIARGTFSILSSLGARDLIARTPDEYVELNVALGRDESRRRVMRETLRRRLEASPLMNSRQFVDDLEGIYREMWRDWSRRANSSVAVSGGGATVDRPDPLTPHETAGIPDADLAARHYDDGNALLTAGKLDEAAACYQRALSLNPGFAAAHCNLGLVRERCGRLPEAVECYDKAIALDPANAIAHNNRGTVLNQLGQWESAVASFGRAIELNDRPEFKANFVHCIRNRIFMRADDSLRRLVARSISEPWALKSELASAGASVVKASPPIKECIKRATAAWPRRLTAEQLYGTAGLAAFARDPLLRALLETTPVCDVELERCLAMARHAMVSTALTAENADPAEEVLGFYCALARQSFLNDYVLPCEDEEENLAASLRKRLVLGLQRGSAIPGHWIAAVASYGPLSSIPMAETLQSRTYPESVRELLTQQIAEPLMERKEREGIPRLTSIDAGVSNLVRQQYEENPYPRWSRLPPATRADSIDLYLRQQFPLATFRPLGKDRKLDILVAGCGTGSEPIRAAQQFPDSRILAIDLSLTSLGYAKRKTREIGLTNVEYAQADILNVASVGRSFDVVSSVGVLHHLEDPAVGLQRLVSLLRRGGFMRLGFYSEMARRAVVEARQFIERRGYTSSAADIRRCRQDLIDEGAEFAALTKSGDFYSTSDCRDLLFHVQEHRFTLPEVDRLLSGAGLELIGFSVDSSVASAYATRFPDDKHKNDLGNWHLFESEFPDTFAAMYDFWVQKPVGP